MTDFAANLRRRCRHRRSKLPEPVANLREAFGCSGCYGSFYRHRCRICEEPLERRREDQNICRKATCRNAWKSKDGLGRYYIPASSKLAPESHDFIEPKLATKPDRAWRIVAGPELSASTFRCGIVDAATAVAMIAASLSGDPVMLEMYQSGDPYLTFAKRVGAVPPDATKKSHAVIRDKYKNMLLSVQYGMSARTLAARLGVSLLEAQEMLLQHKTWFSMYWRWSSDYMHHAFNTGVMHTTFGWYCRTGITEFNERSVRNWPIQSTGADILRIACIMAVRHGIKLVAPVHDAVLIEAPIARIERRASRIVLNADPVGDHELRTDAKIVRYPDRYSDPRGEKIWNDVVKMLDLEEARPATIYPIGRKSA
jgi:hypothetical protein